MILTALIAAGVLALCAALRRRLTGAAPRPLWGGRAALEPMYNRRAAFGLKLTGRPLRVLTAGALALLTWTAAHLDGPAASWPWGVEPPTCMSACGTKGCWIICAFPACREGGRALCSTPPTLPFLPGCCSCCWAAGGGENDPAGACYFPGIVYNGDRGPRISAPLFL